MQGLAVCLGKSKQESYLHRNLNEKTAASFVPIASDSAVLPGKRWRGLSPLLLLTHCSYPGIGDLRKQVGPCPPLKNLMLVAHGSAISCSRELKRSSMRAVECS